MGFSRANLLVTFKAYIEPLHTFADNTSPLVRFDHEPSNPMKGNFPDLLLVSE